MIDPTEAAELCEGVAEIIKELGWCKQAFFNNEGNACLLGAKREFIWRKSSTAERCNRARCGCKDMAASSGRPLAEALGFNHPRDIVRYNDDHKTTLEDVLTLLEERAKFWRNQ